MALLSVNFRAGDSIFDQVTFAAIKAFVSGEFQPGQAFPSYRALAADLRIHPNTAHKVIQHLIREEWLEMQPGKGTVVATPPVPRSKDRKRLLSQEVEQLVVEAKRLGIDRTQVMEAIDATWSKLDGGGK